MAVAVRSRSRVLVEALTGAAAPTDVLRAVRGRGAFLLEDGTASGWSYLVPRPRAVLERHDPAGAFAAARALLDRAASDAPRGCPAVLGRHRGIVRLRPRARARGSARDRAGRPRASGASAASGRRAARVRPPARDRARVCAERRRHSTARGAVRGGAPRRPCRRPEGGVLDVLSYADYRPLAERVLEHIDRGDVYQANLTHRLSGRCSSAVELYAELRRTAPVPYNLYLDGGSFELAGASPETFLRADPDGSIETPADQGNRSALGRRRRGQRARGRARREPEGSRREHDDRRPHAQRPQPGLHPGQRPRVRAVRGRVAPDGAPDGLDGRGSASARASTRWTRSRRRSRPDR